MSAWAAYVCGEADDNVVPLRAARPRDQRRGVRGDCPDAPVGSVGYEAEANERGERLIGMVGVGLGYIVTDAI
jgi:hypothetical protein